MERLSLAHIGSSIGSSACARRLDGADTSASLLGTLPPRFRKTTRGSSPGDHGIQLGDRGWTGKISIALHPELIQVPLVIVHPEGLRAGEQTSYHGSTHDLARTLLSMVGLRTPDHFEGVDLSTLLRGVDPPELDIVYGGYSDSHFLRSEHWTYMSDNALKRPKLLDLVEDPGETSDVALGQPDVVEELHATIVDRVGGPIPSYTG